MAALSESYSRNKQQQEEESKTNVTLYLSMRVTIAVVLTNTFTEKWLLRGGKSRGLARVFGPCYSSTCPLKTRLRFLARSFSAPG